MIKEQKKRKTMNLPIRIVKRINEEAYRKWKSSSAIALSIIEENCDYVPLCHPLTKQVKISKHHSGLCCQKILQIKLNPNLVNASSPISFSPAVTYTFRMKLFNFHLRIFYPRSRASSRNVFLLDFCFWLLPQFH